MAKKKPVNKEPSEQKDTFATAEEITKVVRTGKATATVTVEIPAKDSAIIPIGRVDITIVALQSEINFEGTNEAAEESGSEGLDE